MVLKCHVIFILELEARVTTKTVSNHCCDTLMGSAELAFMDITKRCKGVTGPVGRCWNSTWSIIVAKLVQVNSV